MTYPPEPPRSTYPPEPVPAFPADEAFSQYGSPPPRYSPSTTPPPPPRGFEADAGSDSPSTTDAAKEQASQVGDTAAEAGAQVAGVAKEQALDVAEQTKTEAKNLLGQTREELGSQAATQQQRVAGGLRSLGSELQAMAEGRESAQDGPARQVAAQAADRISTAASWLEAREPGQVLTEVQRFARQRPGAFLALAAMAGVAAGRLTRGLTADSQADSSADARTGVTQTDSHAAVPGSAPVAQSVEPSPFAVGTPRSMTDPAPAYGTTMPPVDSGHAHGTPAPPAPWTPGSPPADDTGYQDPNAGRIGQ